MSKTLSILSVTLFALLFAGAAMAAPADQLVPDAESAAVQTVQHEPAPAVTAPAADGSVCEVSDHGQGPPPKIEKCGNRFCPPHFFCCNPLENLCVPEGDLCIL